MYGIHGVCSILNFEIRSVGGKKIEYYVLEPLDQPGARYYVPTNNEAAVAKLRPILTHQELDALLQGTDACADAWIEDETQRKQHYKQILASVDRAALVCMLHTLHRRKQEQLAGGRKFHLCDENFLRDAEKILDGEFSLVLNIAQDQVGAYVRDALEAR